MPWCLFVLISNKFRSISSLKLTIYISLLKLSRDICTLTPFQYIDRLSRFANYHCKDNTAARPSYLYNGNPYTGKTASFYWDDHLFVLLWFVVVWYWARFLSLARSKLRLCSANHWAGYFSNLPSDWLSIVWAYSEQETENGPWSSFVPYGRRLSSKR